MGMGELIQHHEWNQSGKIMGKYATDLETNMYVCGSKKRKCQIVRAIGKNERSNVVRGTET